MSNVLPRERTGNCQPWEAPQVGNRRKTDLTPPANVDEQRRKAYDESFAKGHAEGLAAAKESLAKLKDRLDSILDALQQPLAAADDDVIEKLSSLAIALAQRLVRREMRTDRAEVVGVVREALAVLPVGLRDIRLHLHPEDARLVSEILVPAEGDAAWQIVEDPVIARGGCRISSPTSQVDATVQTRLGLVINSMLGGERGDDIGMSRDG